ncbi:MAG: alpha-hydroxy acid oxidase [Actinomycetota bacterium]
MSKRQERRIADALTTADLWKLASQRIPPIAFEYFRGAADDETTARGNVQAFQQSVLTAYSAVKFDSVDMSTTAAGFEMDVPWYVSPVGSLCTLTPSGDAVASRVAGEFGTVMAQSTLSGTPMEEVTAASSGDCWFQLYLLGGKETALRTIARARAAGFGALVLTIDTGVSGYRAGHERMKPMAVMAPFAGKSVPEKAMLAARRLAVGPQFLTRLPFLYQYFADGGLMEFVNALDEDGNPMPYTDIGTQLGASAVTWNDIGWVKEAWGADRPLIIKGVHCAQDARRAEELGATAVVWSNHGGRQQDRVSPVLHIVEQEMPKVGDTQLEFFMDGGIRNGTDVLIALTYGLRAVGLGRVTAAGLGAGGYPGLTRAFEILRSELDRAMRLVGVQSVEEIRSEGAALRRESLLVGNDHLPPFVF